MKRRKAIAGGQLFVSLCLLVGIWLALPARWLWVDLPGTLLALAALLAGVALLARTTWSLRVARLVLWTELVIG
ncbi:MAG TPA: hypothetical protein VHZ95_10670, partial [Polyangiales bacterium]|nr:hypothetical protein [Polyangiales bacterium]